MNVSFVGTKALAAELGDSGRGVGISQVVPFPWNLSAPVVKGIRRTSSRTQGTTASTSRAWRATSRPRCSSKDCAAPARSRPAKDSSRRWRRCAISTGRIQRHLYADRSQWFEIHRADRDRPRGQDSSLTRERSKRRGSFLDGRRAFSRQRSTESRRGGNLVPVLPEQR